jgi:hypothetical protein
VPAAAVIPALVVYIKVVAVKKLVVEFRILQVGPSYGGTGIVGSYLLGNQGALYWVLWGTRTFTVKKLECLRQAYA